MIFRSMWSKTIRQSQDLQIYTFLMSIDFISKSFSIKMFNLMIDCGFLNINKDDNLVYIIEKCY